MHSQPALVVTLDFRANGPPRRADGVSPVELEAEQTLYGQPAGMQKLGRLSRWATSGFVALISRPNGRVSGGLSTRRKPICAGSKECVSGSTSSWAASVGNRRLSRRAGVDPKRSLNRWVFLAFLGCKALQNVHFNFGRPDGILFCNESPTSCYSEKYGLS